MTGQHEFVEIINPSGTGGYLLVCEHASNHIPAEYDNLGLDETALHSHIAFDPGARAVALALAGRLDAPLIAQCASRLLHDCNRPAASEDATLAMSDRIAVPGNQHLTLEQRRQRSERFYHPFHAAVEGQLDAMISSGIDPVIVTIHSFNRLYLGNSRSVEFGILHDQDQRLADEMLTLAHAWPGIDTRRNDPYGPEDGVAHSLHVHGEARDLLHVMLEIRNDLIATADDQVAWADRIAELLQQAVTRLRANLTGLTR